MVLYCGWDLHKKYSHCVVMDDKGKIKLDRRVDHQPTKLLGKVFDDFEDKPVVAIEATSNWYWMYQLLENTGATVKLVHPKKVKAIASAKVKTDRIDAKILAHLLRSDLLPEAYIPPIEIRDLREELRYRAALVMLRTGVKNRVRHLLGRLGISLDGNSLWGPSGTETIEAMNLPAPFRYEWEGYKMVLDVLDRTIEKAEARLYKKTNRDKPEIRILTSIPGVGLLSALFIMSEVGDIKRFLDAKHFCSYAGLTPSVHSSGQACYTGHITKQGSKWLRWIFVEDATIAVRAQGPLKENYLRLRAKKGHQIAVIACARKLAKYAYNMLSKNITWKDFIRTYYGEVCS